ncbi:MAG TPA: SMC family ATPase [candidate division Zixibacteria bacterium]|nr:SMC family ATPase [candidate division Zixibacteria bacterium]MDD4917908.1 SMC family ATPase [candidate division Zixibacteria bacterium]MDM7972015.1 SMC family ATPase [candidate division Zixibacteria bacterium]HOD66208.1 SMC family ATPase [candidate division Zixibacteria bacterium]HPM38146.1 SMC family ATPase [candidate division Zixibacteria bacterium]
MTPPAVFFLAMRLSSLKIRNFRVLKSVDLTFADEVIGITGGNGAGKSSLVEAIAWALYGNQAARSRREEIKAAFARPEDLCEVSLEFLINDEKYRVIRRLVGKSERPEVELYRGESSESVGVNETRKYVGELLGLDWRGFLTSFLARQQELNALSVLQPARRKDHLAGMLGIDRLERAIVRVKEDVKIAGGQTELLARQVADGESLTTAIAQLTARRSELEGLQSAAAAERKAAEEAFAAARAEYIKAQETRAAWSELGAGLEAARKTAAALAVRLKELEADTVQLAQADSAAAEVRARIAALEPARRELEVLSEARARRQLLDQMERQRTELQAELDQTARAVEESARALAGLESDLAAIPASITAAAEAGKADLDAARQEYGRLLAEQKSIEVQKEKLAAQMRSIASLGPDSVCDRCLRPFGDDLPAIRRHLAEELEQLTAAFAGLGRELASAAARGTQLKQQAEALEARSLARRELVIRREAAAREREALSARLAELGRRGEAARVKIAEIGEVVFDEDRFAQAQQAVAALEAEHRQLHRLEGQLARREAVTAARARTDAALVQAQAEADTLLQRRDGLGYAEETFAACRERFEAAQARFETAREAAVGAVKEFELTGRELDGKREQLARLEAARAQLDQSRARQYYGEKLAGLFAEFRELLISRIRPTLSDISGRLLAEMTDGRYSMVELDEKYNLQVLDDGQFYGIDRFSGGEKDLANLCLRLAISEALLQSAGIDRSFIILDEVFGSQDDGRKELIVQALTNLTHRFPQIFLITHVGDIRDRVECLIEVAPTGLGWSKVTVRGEETEA